jgi:hypothetical protein
MPVLNRKELLQRLLAVQPGSTSKDVSPQSSCVVLRKGRLYTMNVEVSCSLPSGLPTEMEGAVSIVDAIALLKELPDEELELKLTDNYLMLKGSGRRQARLAREAEVTMPLDRMEYPKTWQRLHETFSEAVDVVSRCAKNKAAHVRAADWSKTCVHIHPSWLEASDNIRMARYTIETFVAESVLVRAANLKDMAQLGMTHGCETPSWLHFHNPIGLRFSIRKFALTDYPPLEQYLSLRGKAILFPQGLASVIQRAAIMAEGDDVTVALGQQTIAIRGEKTAGDMTETLPFRYDGKPVLFQIPYKVFVELLTQHQKGSGGISGCEITPVSLRVNGGAYVYVSGLEIPREGTKHGSVGN